MLPSNTKLPTTPVSKSIDDIDIINKLYVYSSEIRGDGAKKVKKQSHEEGKVKE